MEYVSQTKFCLHVSQLLFSRGTSVFAPPTDRSVSFELNNLERAVKLNKKSTKPMRLSLLATMPPNNNKNI